MFGAWRAGTKRATDQVDVTEGSSGLTRRSILRAGALSIGALGAVRAEAGDAAAASTQKWQIGWRFCQFCYGLWWPTSGSVCQGNQPFPSEFGAHSVGSNVYECAYETAEYPDFGYQDGWRYCHKCHLLHYGSGGRCPAGGAHSAGNTNYAVAAQDLGGGTYYSQFGWRYCSRCRGLWYAAGRSKGACPGYDGHIASGWNYFAQSYTKRNF